MNDATEIKPLPASAVFVLIAARINHPYVYRFHEDRWHLKADGEEYMLIDLPEGLYLVDNPF